MSSVEIYFSFYTLPVYVGIIKDSEVDFLCFEKDEILVNDDDHEDLVRVCKLIQFIGKKNRVKSDDLKFQELYRVFSKK
jgi:hypothetical protein